jgi:hypothetical protein
LRVVLPHRVVLAAAGEGPGGREGQP